MDESNDELIQKSALKGQNLYKAYKSSSFISKSYKVILDNLNINVTKGEM
jgi:hypothetical protein